MYKRLRQLTTTVRIPIAVCSAKSRQEIETDLPEAVLAAVKAPWGTDARARRRGAQAVLSMNWTSTRRIP